jgi:alpha-tubulin suppressor-like RCC1 family protein
MVWAWGVNTYGELGDGTTDSRSSPVSILRSDSYVAISASRFESCGYFGGHSLALSYDGTVWAWGLNSSGELGDGTIIDRSSPVFIARTGPYQAIAAGGEHSLAIESVVGLR